MGRVQGQPAVPVLPCRRAGQEPAVPSRPALLRLQRQVGNRAVATAASRPVAPDRTVPDQRAPDRRVPARGGPGGVVQRQAVPGPVAPAPVPAPGAPTTVSWPRVPGEVRFNPGFGRGLEGPVRAGGQVIGRGTVVGAGAVPAAAVEGAVVADGALSVGTTIVGEGTLIAAEAGAESLVLAETATVAGTGAATTEAGLAVAGGPWVWGGLAILGTGGLLWWLLTDTTPRQAPGTATMPAIDPNATSGGENPVYLPAADTPQPAVTEPDTPPAVTEPGTPHETLRTAPQVPGLYQGIPTDVAGMLRILPGYRIKESEISTPGMLPGQGPSLTIKTDIWSPDGAYGWVSCTMNPDGTFSIDRISFSTFAPEYRWIRSSLLPPMVPGRGTPLSTALLLRHQKMLEQRTGSGPAAGGTRTVRVGRVSNEETIFRYAQLLQAGRTEEEAIRRTLMYRLAENTVVQSGGRIGAVRVDGGVTRTIASMKVFELTPAQIRSEYGLFPRSPVQVGFDILITVEP